MNDTSIMGTIEVMKEAVAKKFELLQRIIRKLQGPGVGAIDLQIHRLIEDYELGSTALISDYYRYIEENRISATTPREKKNAILRRREQFKEHFQKFLIDECILSKIHFLLNSLQVYIHEHKIEVDIPELEINDFEINYTFSPSERDYTLCDCGAVMNIDETTSMLICKSSNCGILVPLTGVLFEDDYYYLQDGKRTKHCNYDPCKHCKIWIEKIQARESVDIPASIINDIREQIYQEGILNKSDISCEHIRKYLRLMNQSMYYNHVPLIRKLLTGIEPPQLTDEEQHMIVSYFNKIARIYDKIKSNKNPNLRYHPYFIYKIIEHILRETHQKRRRQEILSCIHLQSRETLIEHDRIWKQICEKIPEIEYKPTNRSISL